MNFGEKSFHGIEIETRTDVRAGSTLAAKWRIGKILRGASRHSAFKISLLEKEVS